MPVLLSLVRMELNGFGLCEAECETLKSVLKAKLRMLEGEAYRLANRAFSLTSLDDVAHVLFVELRLPHDGNTSADVPVTKRRNLGTNRRSATSGSAGNRKLGKTLSTNKEVLERLKRLHPLPAVILEWRRVNCALCKVVFPLQKEKQDCARLDMARIHCSSQLHTATGRVSFTEPNLQNVPKDFEIDLPSVISDSQPGVTGADVKSKRGRRSFTAVQPGASCPGPAFSVSMRNAFIPFTGGVLLAADYSQLELRLITHLADDPRLRRILNSGGDVFKMIAGEMSGIPAESVSDGQRQRAKQICYGIIYGIGARSLAEQLGVHEDEATVFIENFKSRFSGVRKYLEETIEGCRAGGYVRTITKRRRYLPAITSANAHARAQAERQAVNTTVQGSAADLMKKAMIKIDERLVREFPACIQTHGHKQEGSVTRPRARRAKPGGQKPEGGYMVLQLHDELIFETSERDLGRVARIVKEEMEGALELCVPLPVKMKAGPSWGKMTSYDP